MKITFALVMLLSGLDFAMANTYEAFNVGGANRSCRVISYEANTIFTVNNGVPLKINKAGESHDFKCRAFDSVQANKPFYVSGLKTEKNSAGSFIDTQVGWQPLYFAGTEFITTVSETFFSAIHIQPVEQSATKIALLYNGGLIEQFNGGKGFKIELTGHQPGQFEIRSSHKILVHFSGRRGKESRILPPKAKQVIGFPSTKGWLTSEDVATVDVDSSAADSYSMSVDNNAQFLVASGSALFSGESFLVTSPNLKISVNSASDSDGSSGTPFIPTHLTRHQFIVSGATDYVAMAATDAVLIEEIDAATGKLITIHKMTGAQPYKLNLAGNYEGRIFRSAGTNGTFQLWFQPSTTTKVQVFGKETMSFGW